MLCFQVFLVTKLYHLGSGVKIMLILVLVQFKLNNNFTKQLLNL